MYRLLAVGVFWVALHAPALGQMSEFGQMSEQEIQREADLHQTCIGADRNPNACRTVGEMYRDGVGVPQRYDRAIFYYQIACGAGLPGACMDLGGMYETGHLQNFAEAAANYERACRLEHPLGCGNLSGMYREGRGVPQDPARATAYYRLYCEHGGFCFD